MRKSLVLILVLGMATAASAVEVQVNGQTGEVLVPGDTFATVTVVSEDAGSWLGYLIVDEGGAGALSQAEALAAAGDLGATAAYTEAGWGGGYELLVAASPDGTIAEGTQFTAQYHYSDYVTGTTISLYIDPEYAVPAASASIIPEPMAVVLLGLGGLFLRRRK